jgi:hypothetical protein
MATIEMRTEREWSFDVLSSDTDGWPAERPQPYSRVGRMYQPIRLSIKFTKHDGRPLDKGWATLYGPRILKGGALGVVVDEHLYGPLPAFLEPAISECLAMIDKDLNGEDGNG